MDIDGCNNNIIIDEINGSSRGHINICLAGNCCTVIIEDGVSVAQNLNIVIGQRHPHFGSVENVVVRIGAHTSFEGCSIVTYNSNASIDIGQDCMVSSAVTILHTESHPVYDAGSGNIINK